MRSSGCWLWTGTRQPQGYGRLNIDRQKLLAHRLSFEINVGPIPDGLCVLHTCDVKACVRPDHLYAGTRRDNARDVIERGSFNHRRGENHPDAKLNEAQVAEIRRRYQRGKVRHLSLAHEFGVSESTIGSVVLRRTWRHLDS